MSSQDPSSQSAPHQQSPSLPTHGGSSQAESPSKDVGDEESLAGSSQDGSPSKDVGDEESLAGSPSKDVGDEESREQARKETEDLVDQLKQKLKDEENWKDCLRDYFCCMVFRKAHEDFFKSEKVKDKPLHVQQKVLKNYLNGIAKERLLWAIGFLLVALFCLGAMNFMENLDEMFNKTTDCKVDLDVTNSRGSRVQDSFVVARLLTGKCPKPEMDNIDLGPNGYLAVKYVECDVSETPIVRDSVCFNIFRCEKTVLEELQTCRPLFPLTANIN